MVAQIGELVVDGCGGKQEHLGVNTRGDVLHQSLVVVSLFRFTGAPGGGFVVPEVVRFVDDHEIVSGPVERAKIKSVGFTAIAGKVNVVEHVETKTVCNEWIQRAGLAVNGPVATQLLGAENEDFFVAKFEILDDRERGVGFAQPDAIGQDAAVVFFDFINGGTGAVPLKRIKRPPDVGVGKADVAQCVAKRQSLLDITAEKLKERFEINKLRRLVAINLEQIIQDGLLHIFHARCIVPEFLKPELQVRSVAVIGDHKVEFDVVVAGAKTKPASGEIGTANNGRRNFTPADVRHLAMQKAGAPNRANLNMVANPCRADLGDVALIQAGRKGKPVVAKNTGGTIFVLRIDVFYECRLTEKEAYFPELIQLCSEFVACENRKVCRDDIQISPGAKLVSQKIPNRFPAVIVADAAG